MDTIRKKICLEDFKSRIPASIDYVGYDENDENSQKHSWGKFPKSIEIMGKKLNYKNFIELYYEINNVIKNSTYYTYNRNTRKWVKKDYEWRQIYIWGNNLDPEKNCVITYVSNLPQNSYSDYEIIYGVTTPKGEEIFDNGIKEIFGGDNDGFNFILESNNIIGKIIIPYYFKNEKGEKYFLEGELLPNFIYLSELEKYLDLMNKLKKDEMNCCETKIYSKHGGDNFNKFLKTLEVKTIQTTTDKNRDPKINIPILLVNKNVNLGDYKVHDFDVVDENGDNIVEYEKVSNISQIITTSGESKLRTLRMNKKTVDINGNILPFILEDEVTKMPYKKLYVKNIQMHDNKLYGDTIHSMNETATPKEITESDYNNAPKNVCKENPITDNNMINEEKEISLDKDFATETENLKNIFIEKLKNELYERFEFIYPEKCYIKQNYHFKYTQNEKSYENSGSIYIGFENPEIEITYVIGGEIKMDNQNAYYINEINPFTPGIESWNGNGIWYKEKYPMKKLCKGVFEIEENEEIELIYDEIDFASKEITYEAVDFERKNYILCNEIKYKSNSREEINYPLFRDDKMVNLTSPLKEDYKVYIDRGYSAAFEKHLQLSEIKSWEDLENYRNGYFIKN